MYCREEAINERALIILDLQVQFDCLQCALKNLVGTEYSRPSFHESLVFNEGNIPASISTHMFYLPFVILDFQLMNDFNWNEDIWCRRNEIATLLLTSMLMLMFY